MRQQHARPAQMPSPQNQFARVERRSYESASAPRIPQASSRPDTKVVDLHSASRASSTSNRNSSSNSNTKKKAEATLKIAIKEPRVYSEATDIGKILMANDAVLVNFHLMEEHSAARCVDFFTGITYAIDGDIQRVGNQVFLCTPASIQIDGNQARSLLHEHNFDL
jgi:cell division inhibitor SepF